MEGFSHRLPALVDAVFGTLRELDVTEEVFARVLEGLQLKVLLWSGVPGIHAVFFRYTKTLLSGFMTLSCGYLCTT